MKRPIRQHTFTKSNFFHRTWRWFSIFCSEHHTNCNNISLSPPQHISNRLICSAQTRIPCRIKGLLRALLDGDHKLVANHVTGLPAFPWILMGLCYCLPVRCSLDITLSRQNKPISRRFQCRVMLRLLRNRKVRSRSSFRPISVAARLLGSRVRIPQGEWMSVSCEFCVLCR